MVTIAEARIGTGGTMFIDDDGTYIRWYLKQDDPATAIYSPGKEWAVTVNGQNLSGRFTWAPGTAGAIRLIAGPAQVTTNQVVAFAIGNTDTQGFGGGGTIYGTVNRATIPNAPTPATFSEVKHTSMRVSWQLAGDGGSPYNQILLRRSLTPDFASYVDYPLGANATSAVPGDLVPNTLYYWRVFARNALGYGPPSGTTSQRTASVPAAPGTPTATEITPNSVRLTWTIPANGGMPIDQMLLRRSTSADFSKDVVDTPLAANATTAVATALNPGTTYYWRVYAHNVVGYSAPSGTRQATTQAAGAPSLTMTRTDTASSAALTVPSGISGFTKFSLQRRIVGQATIVTTDSATSPINTSGLTATTRYEWRASAWYGDYQSPWTGWISTPAAPATPTASEITPTSMRLTWAIPTDTGGQPITQMLLRYSTSPTFATFTDVPLAATAKTAVVNSLDDGTTYYWRVFARTSVGYSQPSPTRSQSTLPAGAPGLTVTAAPSGTSSSAAITPPGGATGFTKFTLQRRVAGTTTPVTTLEAAASPIGSPGLTPGRRYEYRASAWYGEYQSPWTLWVGLTQPNPNTDPGTYFDGSTADSASVDYAWSGTANNSTSTATSLKPAGWRTFEEGENNTGATGAVYRALGGAHGSYCARAVFFTDATAAGFIMGPGGPTLNLFAEIGENVKYVGSIYAWPSKSQRLAATIRWHQDDGTYISSTVGVAEVVNTGGWTRLEVTGTSPIGARKALVVIQDVAGTGWSAWHGGDWLQGDSAMISAQTLYPFFDGNTPDTADFSYEWTGVANASASLRRDVIQATVNPLLDPDCPPLVSAPTPPAIETDCIDVIGTWRRYWIVIPEEEVFDWLAVVPTLTISTGAVAARQVRIRFYQNPNNLPPAEAMGLVAESEQIITYIPPHTIITLDGVSESVWASVSGAAEVSADHLLMGTGGVPASWPVLSCGDAYLVSFDVPLDAPEGNVELGAALTTRMM
ncbi:minor tail protein [Microbacterium phage Fizzles]|nr:minor tail protein [Microbacterium phage Fizzles]